MGGGGLKFERRERKADAARGIWVVRRWMSQSMSSSIMRVVVALLARKVRRACRWPSQARAEPRVRVEVLGLVRRWVMSDSVHWGCGGIVMSREVMFAARSRPDRRGDWGRETARIDPNCSLVVSKTYRFSVRDED